MIHMNHRFIIDLDHDSLESQIYYWSWYFYLLYVISLLYQIIYGSHITDNYDQQAVSALVDYWLSPNAVKKDFEERRCKFVFGDSRVWNWNLNVNQQVVCLYVD